MSPLHPLTNGRRIGDSARHSYLGLAGQRVSTTSPVTTGIDRTESRGRARRQRHLLLGSGQTRRERTIGSPATCQRMDCIGIGPTAHRAPHPHSGNCHRINPAASWTPYRPCRSNDCGNSESAGNPATHRGQQNTGIPACVTLEVKEIPPERFTLTAHQLLVPHPAPVLSQIDQDLERLRVYGGRGDPGDAEHVGPLVHPGLAEMDRLAVVDPH